MIVGLSISESPDLERLGFSDLHLRDAMIEFARHLLAFGHGIAYGGDLRPSGFTMALRDFVGTFAHGSGKVHNYLAWHVHKSAVKKNLVDLARVAQLHYCKLPLPSKTFPSFKRASVSRAMALTEMRKEMGRAIGARLLLGGKLAGYKGLLPGLLEETVLAIRASMPVYLVGAFGGCTAAIIDVLLGHKRLDLVMSETGNPERMELFDGYRKCGMDPERLIKEAVATVADTGIEALAHQNGLTPKENRVLFDSSDLDLVISLLLKGLSQKSRRPRK